MKSIKLLPLLLSVCILAIALQGGATESPEEKRQKRKKFGSSLSRLQWDPRKQAVVDKERKGKEASAVGPDGSIKLETLYVVFDAMVVEAATSRPVTGLGKDDFIVTEDGSAQQVATFALGDDASVGRSIILIIDYSNSQAPFFEMSIEAAKNLVDQLAPSDRMAIVTDDVELLLDFTQDRPRLKAALDSIRKRWQQRDFGRSFQFTALFATLRELVEGQERTIIIFQTDGDEARSRTVAPISDSRFKFTLSDIYAEAERSQATIYALLTNERLVNVPPDQAASAARRGIEKIRRNRFKTDEEYRNYIEKNPITGQEVDLYVRHWGLGQAAVSRVAQLTGGWATFLESPEQAKEVYSKVLFDINRRYLIGYYPTNTERDGRVRRVQIRVRDHPEYIVKGRNSYVAPGRN